MTFLTLFGCAVVLFVHMSTSLGGANAVSKDMNYQQLLLVSAAEQTQQRVLAERRATVFQSCTQLAGAAVAFLALALLLAAAQGGMETAGQSLSAWERIARLTPGMVALVCATLIFAYGGGQTAGGSGTSGVTPFAYPAPISIAPTAVP
jgi:hypothetical protein